MPEPWSVLMKLFLIGAFLGTLARVIADLWNGKKRKLFLLGRPLLVGIGFGLFAAFYWFWTVAPEAFPLFADSLYAESLKMEPANDCVFRYAVHLVLFFFLLTATLTDFDRYIIPDALTIPGTLLLLIAMTALPAALPAYYFVPSPDAPQEFEQFFEPLSALSPLDRDKMTIAPLAATLLGCWSLWCFALLDRRWYTRLGFRRAAALFNRRLMQSPLTGVMAAIWTFGIVAILFLLYRHFQDSTSLADAPRVFNVLFSALVGTAAGLLIVWTVRIVGRLTLGREAMGFGDVVFMGMIGAVVGWQGGVIVFFLAPFAGLIFGLVRALIRSEREIPYGPFLALGTVALLIFWPFLWRFVEPVFSDAWAILILAGIGVALLVVLLWMIRGIKKFIFR